MKVADLFENEWDNEPITDSDVEYTRMLRKRETVIAQQGMVVQRIDKLLKNEQITMYKNNPAFDPTKAYEFWGMDSFAKPGTNGFQNEFYVSKAPGIQKREAMMVQLRYKWSRLLEIEKALDTKIEKALNTSANYHANRGK